MSEARVMQQIGFVGLGAMGSVMAPLPARAGFSVIGFDTAPQRPDLADVTNARSLTDHSHYSQSFGKQMSFCDQI